MVGLLQQADPSPRPDGDTGDREWHRTTADAAGRAGPGSLAMVQSGGHPLVAQPLGEAEIIMASSSIRRICILDAPSPVRGQGARANGSPVWLHCRPGGGRVNPQLDRQVDLTAGPGPWPRGQSACRMRQLSPVTLPLPDRLRLAQSP